MTCPLSLPAAVRPVLWLLLTALWSVPPFAAQAQSPALDAAIQSLADHPAMAQASLSVEVRRITDNAVLAAYDADRSLVPASTVKAITTVAALGILGHNHTFKTRLMHDGTIKDGVLYGNIYIVGGGDPTLASPYFDGVRDLDALLKDWTATIRRAGIRAVLGFVLGDNGAYGSALPVANWQWNDIGNYYGVGATGLNLHENLYFLHLQQRSGLGDTPPIIGHEPAQPYLTFTNELTSAARGTGDQAYIFGAPYTYHRYVRGTIPVGSDKYTIKGAMPDPAYFAAFRLMQALDAAGISVKGGADNAAAWARSGHRASGKRVQLAVVTSPTVEAIVQRTNEQSVNLYAEALLKAIGAHRGAGPTTEAGVAAVRAFWEERGIDMSGFFLEDGSGLSPRNGVTASQLCQIMSKSARDKDIYAHFKPSLAIGGKTGTASGMFKGTSAVGRVFLKSGSMRRVRAYTGYITTRTGELRAFAILANNFEGESSDMRKLMERVMVAMVEE